MEVKTMNLEKLSSPISRIMLLSAFFLLLCASLERVMNLIGYTFLRATNYRPGQLVQFSTPLLLFVLAFLLRQIRDELRRQKT
jgi:hypothetical protein